MLIGISFSYGASNVLINPPSEWIKIADPSLNSDIHPDAKDSHYLLYDRQVNATSVKEQYFRMAYRLLNETSVEENGQQYFDFSPDYQTLIFHSLRVIRDGEIINKLSKEQIKIIQREQDAEKLMLDGRLSAYIILDDLRKNDIIDYSYTIKGSNPALNNLFYSYVQLEWATPIDELNYRLLWPKNETLNYKPVSTQLSPKIIEGEKYTEYSIRDTHTNAVHIDDQSPYWFDPRGRITFSNQSSWGDIVDWALPLYEPATNANLENIVADIKKQSNSQEGQLSLALQFVQNEIRYLGIEIGEGSFIPSDINTTLDKRYADCKGKVLLLLSLMKALNIEGYAALVNSYITNELSI
jgi:transglutaminase-like putative cysteine protease